MHYVIRIALAFELVITALEQVFPLLNKFLPFGGSHFTQLAVILLLSVAVAEFLSARPKTNKDE